MNGWETGSACRRISRIFAKTALAFAFFSDILCGSRSGNSGALI
jgi:hypothetical protein